MTAIVLRIASLFLCAFMAMQSFAAQVPQPSPVDPRIRTVMYNPREVVTITGHIGYQMVIQFSPLERIENISLGDSQAWQVTPNRKANLLFLKPIDRIPGTNMTIITNMRHYNFELIVSNATTIDKKNQVYDIQFVYFNDEFSTNQSLSPLEEPEANDVPAPENWNFSYSYTGSKANIPVRVFDDGKYTYFRWNDDVETPAIFTADEDGNESLVNYITKGNYFVVQKIARNFVLRNSKNVTYIHNDGIKEKVSDITSPQPRKDSEKKPGLWKSLFHKNKTS